MKKNKYQHCLIHGWGIGAGVWTVFAEKLGEENTTRLLNMPGYGPATANQQNKYKLEIVAEQLSKHILPGAILIGWSLGGMVAIKIAELMQNKVAALILLASTPCFVKKKDWPHGVDENRLQKITAGLNSSQGKVLNKFFSEIAIGDSSPRDTIRTLRSHASKINTETLAYGLEILRTEDLRNNLGDLDCPVAMVLGANDQFVAASTGAATKKICPDLTLIEIASSGHAPFLSRTDKTLEEINTFVEDL